MTDKPKQALEVQNPRYMGATPEMVGLALLRHDPESDDGEADSLAEKPQHDACRSDN